jgi:hypothetical protein
MLQKRDQAPKCGSNEEEKNPSSPTMALGSTQSLTEISTRNLPVGKGRPALKADNLTAIWVDDLEDMGASTFHNPMGLHGLIYG